MGRGLAHPENIMTQDEAYELACMTGQLSERQRRVLRVLYRRSGVRQRYTALPHRIALDWLGKEKATASEALQSPAESSPEVRGPTTQERMEFYQQQAGTIAINAARDALLDAELQHGEVTHLVTVSCTGFFAPGVDLQLIQQLDLPRTVQRVNVGFMGCHGMLNGLRTAKALASEPNSKVLWVAVELCSLHYYFPWDPDRMVGNALFSDGAAALVVQAGSDEHAWSVVETANYGRSYRQSPRWVVLVHDL